MNEADLAATAVLSGNRNFEGRINPDVKMNYLASPPLVVAYALASYDGRDLLNDPIGEGSDGNPVYLRDIWPSPQEVEDVIDSAIASEMYTTDYAECLCRRRAVAGSADARGRHVRVGSGFHLRAKPPYFEGMSVEPAEVTDITDARVLLKLGDSVTTDHISPAGAIKGDSPAGRYLSEHRVERKDFNSYGSRRGNHEVMIRGTFANIRLRNQLAPGTKAASLVTSPATAT